MGRRQARWFGAVAGRLLRPARRGVLESSAARRSAGRASARGNRLGCGDGASTRGPVTERPLRTAGAQAFAVAAPAAPAAVAVVPPDVSVPPVSQPVALAPSAPIAPEPLAFTAQVVVATDAALPAPAFALVAPSAAAFAVADIKHRFAPPRQALRQTSRRTRSVAPEMQVPSDVAPKPVTQRITTNPFATLSAAKAEAAARPAAPVITDEVIEEVVSRVLQRLSDKVVRETVTESFRRPPSGWCRKRSIGSRIQGRASRALNP